MTYRRSTISDWRTIASIGSRNTRLPSKSHRIRCWPSTWEATIWRHRALSSALLVTSDGPLFLSLTTITASNIWTKQSSAHSWTPIRRTSSIWAVVPLSATALHYGFIWTEPHSEIEWKTFAVPMERVFGTTLPKSFVIVIHFLQNKNILWNKYLIRGIARIFFISKQRWSLCSDQNNHWFSHKLFALKSIKVFSSLWYINSFFIILIDFEGNANQIQNINVMQNICFAQKFYTISVNPKPNVKIIDRKRKRISK